MKKQIPILLAIGMITLTSLTACTKLIQALFPSFETQIRTVEVTIPVVPGTTAETTLGSASVRYNLDSVIKEHTVNQFDINKMATVKVKSVTINLSNADQTNNIANFESVRLNLTTDNNGTPTTIASTTIPDTYSTSLTVPVTNSPELKEYLKGNQITYTVLGKARRATTKSLNAVIVVTLQVG